MTLTLEVLDDAEAAARRVAAMFVERERESVAARGSFSLALSRAREELLRGLADLPWAETSVYQVDERVAPAGHPDRNLARLLAVVPHDAYVSGAVHAMPVADPDLEQAAERYAAELPEALDLVHLGLGADGHTASLVPGDPVLDVRDRLVAVTGEYEGHRRMTLTYSALEAAREIVWLVTGEAKRDALTRLLARDTSIPAARILNPHQLVVADADAANRGARSP